MGVTSVCLSVLSMLSSAKAKVKHYKFLQKKFWPKNILPTISILVVWMFLLQSSLDYKLNKIG